MNLLSEIISSKQRRVAQAKQLVSPKQLRALASHARLAAIPHAFAGALADLSKVNVIAEFKRRSPSKGEIRRDADAVTTARSYESAGAAAVSVLTEGDYFGGSLDDLRAIEKAISLPILRKDFIFDEYQVYESAAAGAAAVLLIVAALDDESLVRLRRIAEDELGIDALVEVHTAGEMKRAGECGARLIGVNNRDLQTFEVSLETSVQLAQLARVDSTLISESGIGSAVDIGRLRKLGYRGFLIGESLMRAADPGEALLRILSVSPRAREKSSTLVKICGITNLADARAAVEAGADMLGFNFYRPSPRFIEPRDARAIIETLRAEIKDLPRTVNMVGVFVNQPAPESVTRIAKESGINAIQLHGDESAEFCRELKTLLPDHFLIKVIRAGSDAVTEPAPESDVDAFMLDAFDVELRGGTGRTIDWTLARRTREAGWRLFLAGGLAPENVSNAISAVQPYAVDACSALESSPGHKDAERMKAFVRAVRNG